MKYSSVECPDCDHMLADHRKRGTCNHIGYTSLGTRIYCTCNKSSDNVKGFYQRRMPKRLLLAWIALAVFPVIWFCGLTFFTVTHTMSINSKFTPVTAVTDTHMLLGPDQAYTATYKYHGKTMHAILDTNGNHAFSHERIAGVLVFKDSGKVLNNWRYNDPSVLFAILMSVGTVISTIIVGLLCWNDDSFDWLDDLEEKHLDKIVKECKAKKALDPKRNPLYIEALNELNTQFALPKEEV